MSKAASVSVVCGSPGARIIVITGAKTIIISEIRLKKIIKNEYMESANNHASFSPFFSLQLMNTGRKLITNTLSPNTTNSSGTDLAIKYASVVGPAPNSFAINKVTRKLNAPLKPLAKKLIVVALIIPWLARGVI
jgi:hypothetical protein